MESMPLLDGVIRQGSSNGRTDVLSEGNTENESAGEFLIMQSLRTTGHEKASEALLPRSPSWEGLING
jgi:hypothetical protein